MEKWMVAAKKADFNRLAKTFSISPVLARIMVNRGLKTDEEFPAIFIWRPKRPPSTGENEGHGPGT